MEVFGYRPSTFELAVFAAALGVAVAVGSLVVNMLWEAFKHCTGKFTNHGVRRCVACMDPAEPGSYLCAKHTALSNMVRRRSVDRPA
jgi:hypothetical protein